MADSNQLKRIDPIDFGDDDPFAELSKIMGFDPRQPARQPEAPKADTPRPAPAAEARHVPAPGRPDAAVAETPSTPEPAVDLADDFAIDLERELLGGFDAEPATPALEVRAPAATEPVPGVAAEEPAARAEPDFDFSDDFAAELESGLSTVEAPEPEPAEPELEARSDEPFAREDDLFADLDFEIEDKPAEEAAPGTTAIAALPGGDDDRPQDDRLQEEIDLDFDVAMAEVDMEFEAELDQAFSAAIQETEATADEPAEPWLPEEDPAGELDRVIGELDAATHVQPEFEAATFDDAPAFGDAEGGALEAEGHASQPEMSFEDELKALLGAPVRPAVLTGSYDEPAPVEDNADDWAEADDGHAEPPSAAAWEEAGDASETTTDGLDLAEAFDDHAFDKAFEHELAAETPAQPSFATTRFSPAPDIETVEVPGPAVAYADEIDIPELASEEPVPAAAFDDYEPDYSDFFAPSADSRVEPALRQADRSVDPYEAALATTAAATAAIAAVSGQPVRAERAVPHAGEETEASFARQRTDDAPDFALEDGYDQPLDFSDLEAESFEDEAEPRRRGLLVAAVVGGVAILGAVGAFALSFGGGNETEVPALVRADSDPVKVRPEEPGGVTVPNQDNKVFEQMAGKAAAETPSQERLIASSEEPVDIAAQSVDPVADQPQAAAPVKNEERVVADDAQASDSMEVAAVTPRRVKTMVVRPDGTLVPREDDAAAPAAPAAEAPALPPVSEPAAAAPIEPIVPAVPEAPAERTPATASTETPPSAPVAPARPADQPVDVVGEVAPERVAMAAPAGGWAVQIASQPSEESAKATYADLSRRYAGIIGGKPASIVKAEIAGKGTFWRVRIAADSRNDAIGLCERYKAAGGNCFVSK